jgi:hypothetical protein
MADIPRECRSSKRIENKIEIQDTDSSRDARASVITVSKYFKNPPNTEENWNGTFLCVLVFGILG